MDGWKRTTTKMNGNDKRYHTIHNRVLQVWYGCMNRTYNPLNWMLMGYLQAGTPPFTVCIPSLQHGKQHRYTLYSPTTLRAYAGRLRMHDKQMLGKRWILFRFLSVPHCHGDTETVIHICIFVWYLQQCDLHDSKRLYIQMVLIWCTQRRPITGRITQEKL